MEEHQEHHLKLIAAPLESQALQPERRALEEAQPQLVRGFEAFRESYAAYEKMTQQFTAPLELAAQARSVTFKPV